MRCSYGVPRPSSNELTHLFVLFAAGRKSQKQELLLQHIFNPKGRIILEEEKSRDGETNSANREGRRCSKLQNTTDVSPLLLAHENLGGRSDTLP